MTQQGKIYRTICLLSKCIESGDIATRLGYMELADSGTILLDHVDRLNQANQIKLLNYLQEGNLIVSMEMTPFFQT